MTIEFPELDGTGSEMCNIAESVPPRNQFHPIPETRSSFTITDLLVIDRVPPNSVQFRVIQELEAIPEIPESDGIPPNSVSTQFPEFRTGITSHPHPHAVL